MNIHPVGSTGHVRKLLLAATIPTIFSLSGPVSAEPTSRCNETILTGVYVYSATGFTRAPNSPPGTPWVPKGILEVLEFHGDGTLDTPRVTVANPFGDSGDILQPPTGAPGEYSINEDCSGTVHFFDAGNVTFSIHVQAPRGDTIQMIQTNPADNVFVGTANLSW